jgi:hypothetical protein
MTGPIMGTGSATPATPPAPPSLGTITDFATPLANFLDQALQDRALADRAYRWQLHRVATRVLGNTRLSACLTCRRPGVATIRLYRRPATSRAYYQDLIRCQRAWICPMCSWVKVVQTRQDIAAAAARHMAAGGQCFLFTLTIGHTRSMPLARSLTTLLAAYRTCWRKVHKRLKRLGYVASVKILELPRGIAAGWHPHLHIVVFLGGAATLEPVSASMRELWAMAVAEQGGWVGDHGVDVRFLSSDPSAYLTKFGHLPGPDASAPGTPSAGDTSMSYTPFGLLAWHAATDDPLPAELYREFARATKGKHLSQLLPRARAHFGLDDEIACRTDSRAEVATESVGELSLAEWRAVCWGRWQVDLERVAGSGDPTAIQQFVAGCVDRWRAAQPSCAPQPEPPAPDPATVAAPPQLPGTRPKASPAAVPSVTDECGGQHRHRPRQRVRATAATRTHPPCHGRRRGDTASSDHAWHTEPKIRRVRHRQRAGVRPCPQYGGCRRRRRITAQVDRHLSRLAHVPSRQDQARMSTHLELPQRRARRPTSNYRGARRPRAFYGDEGAQCTADQSRSERGPGRRPRRESCPRTEAPVCPCTATSGWYGGPATGPPVMVMAHAYSGTRPVHQHTTVSC